MRTDVKVGLVCVLALVIAVIAYFTLQSKPVAVPAGNGHSAVASGAGADSSGGPVLGSDVQPAAVTPPAVSSASTTPPSEIDAPPVAFTHQPGLAQTPSVYSPPSGSTTAPAGGATLYPPGGAPRDTLLPPLTNGPTPATSGAGEHGNPETPTLGNGRSTEVEPGMRPHDSLIEPPTPGYPPAGRPAAGETGMMGPGDVGTRGAGTYMVQSGDNLTGIARKNHTTVSALKAANPSINPDRLKVKQVINLPAAGMAAVSPTTRPAHTAAAGATTRPAPTAARHHPGLAREASAGAKSTTYTVKRGDSLRKIAKAVYGDETLWRQISRANRAQLSDPNDIEVGMVLRIPAK